VDRVYQAKLPAPYVLSVCVSRKKWKLPEVAGASDFRADSRGPCLIFALAHFIGQKRASFSDIQMQRRKLGCQPARGTSLSPINSPSSTSST
jgi:hypothetical protein